MNLDDMIMVSIDDHVIEPPDMFVNHMPAKYQDRAPRVMRIDGVDHWLFQGDRLEKPEVDCLASHNGKEGHRCFVSGVASWPKAEWVTDPLAYAEMRPGCYDIHSRIADMNAGGILAAMTFPSFPGFAGTHLSRASHDKELTAATVSAYNDWHIDEWCAAYPGRFIPLAIASLYDVEAIVAEIYRVAAKGVTAISLPETPHAMGLPSYFTDHWDPVFAALCDTGMVMCLHIGQAHTLVTIPSETPYMHQTFMGTSLSLMVTLQLYMSGKLKKFPELRIAISEGGIGWIPFFLDKIDRFIVNQEWAGLAEALPPGTPTEIFRRQFLACFIHDPSTLRIADRIGIEAIAWESDYPHSDSNWPSGPDELLAQATAAGLSDSDIDKITFENAARFMRWDPFAAVPREEATVGALRAQAADVETALTSKDEFRRRFELTHSV
jgi:predicted TIM-barrel fold metal-dependent hydrolase